MSDFPQKLLKKLPTGFTDTADSMSNEELEQKILESESHIYEVEKAKDEDEKLTQAREMVKEMSAPYKDAVATEAAKIKYCLFLLESRGSKIKVSSDDV